MFLHHLINSLQQVMNAPTKLYLCNSCINLFDNFRYSDTIGQLEKKFQSSAQGSNGIDLVTATTTSSSSSGAAFMTVTSSKNNVGSKERKGTWLLSQLDKKSQSMSVSGTSSGSVERAKATGLLLKSPPKQSKEVHLSSPRQPGVKSPITVIESSLTNIVSLSPTGKESPHKEYECVQSPRAGKGVGGEGVPYGTPNIVTATPLMMTIERKTELQQGSSSSSSLMGNNSDYSSSGILTQGAMAAASDLAIAKRLKPEFADVLSQLMNYQKQNRKQQNGSDDSPQPTGKDTKKMSGFLTNINLYDAGIGNEGVYILCKYIKGNDKITIINLESK